MLKRLMRAATIVVLLVLPLQAAATDYTDIWYLPGESGWGVNLIQAEDVIFATFFIYGQASSPATPSNQPTWFYAVIYRDANGNFSGNLYSTVGTYFGAPWNHANLSQVLAGTASFFPASPYSGTLTYILSGGPTVSKNIQRQTLKPIVLGGNYTGGQAGTYAGGNCMLAGPYKDNFDGQVTQPGDGTATFQFTYTSGLSCTLSGTLVQHGQLYSIPNATYVCSDGTNTAASMDQIKATAQGIEGTFAAASGAAGSSACSEAAAFLGVLF